MQNKQLIEKMEEKTNISEESEFKLEVNNNLEDAKQILTKASRRFILSKSYTRKALIDDAIKSINKAINYTGR